ncbi:MAG: hypothetical protein AAF587_44985, partial [Bacteroidota bacterium]
NRHVISICEIRLKIQKKCESVQYPTKKSVNRTTFDKIRQRKHQKLSLKPQNTQIVYKTPTWLNL